MRLAIPVTCPPRESVVSVPSTATSYLTRVKTCLAIGCGAGLLLYTGLVLRRRMACPQSPPRVTCPIADNTIALLQELHDGPFRFGDPTSFAMAARAEATRRIRRQQRERRRLRRRIHSQLCCPRNSQRMKSGRTTAEGGRASTLVSNVAKSPDHVEQHTPENKGVCSAAVTATSLNDRGSCTTAPTLSKRGYAVLSSANSAASCTLESTEDGDDDEVEHRVKEGYAGGVYDTNGRLVSKGNGGCRMTPSEASLLLSSSVSSAYLSTCSYSRSSSRSTTDDGSYSSRISTSSLTQSTSSSSCSRGSASSLLAMTTVSVVSPDRIPWQRTMFDGASLGGGGPRSSCNAPQQLQQCNQHYHNRSPTHDATRSYSNLSQHMISGSSSTPCSSSFPNSTTGTTGGQGGRYPVQQVWSSISSPAVGTQTSNVSPKPVTITGSSSALGCCDGIISPEAPYTTVSASPQGAAPSLPLSGRWGGGEEEEAYWSASSAFMYGPPLFATEMDVTDALAELRSSVCCNGSRHGSSCFIGSASSTAHFNNITHLNSSGPNNSSGITAPLNTSTSVSTHHHHHHPHQQQQQQQQQRHHHHTRGHSGNHGYFSGLSVGTSNGSTALPVRDRHAARRAGLTDNSDGGSSRRERRHRSAHTSGGGNSLLTSARYSVKESPANSQWLPEGTLSTQPAWCSGGAPCAWRSDGSECAACDSVASAGSGSFTQAPTATPVSQASMSRRLSAASGGRAHHLPGSGNTNQNFNHSFRSTYSAPRPFGHHGRHRGGGRLRRWWWWRRWLRQARRRAVSSCGAVGLGLAAAGAAMRRRWYTFGCTCVGGWGWLIHQSQKCAFAATDQVVGSLCRPGWLWLKRGRAFSVDFTRAAAASVPDVGSPTEYPAIASLGADAAAEAGAAAAGAAAVDATAKRDGLLATESADEAINNIVRQLEPTPGRVPTVVVIRAPLGYDVSTDAASLWTALHLDSTSFEEGLVDIVIMEELKTGPLPPPQSRGATVAAGAAPKGVDLSENPAGPFMQPCVDNTDNSVAPTTVPAGSDEGDAQAAPSNNPLELKSSAPAASASTAQPSNSAASFTSAAATAAATTTTAMKSQAQLRISFEIYPAHLFYSLIFRAAVLQEKDLALRRAAAELFGGSDAIGESSKGLGANTAANASASSTCGGGGGAAAATPGSPLSLARALSFTFGMSAPPGGGECGSANSAAVTHFSLGALPTGATVVGSGGVGGYCLSPLSPGHFCRTQVSAKQTFPAPHTGVVGGCGPANSGHLNASSAAAGGTLSSPRIVPVSALSSGAVASLPHVVVRLSESYSLSAPPPQMVMSPLLGAQSGFRSSLGPLSPGVSSPAYGGGFNTAAGAAATSSPADRIISYNELLFYIHVLRTTVGDRASTPAPPSGSASEVDDQDDGESRDEEKLDCQRDRAHAAERSAGVLSGVSDATAPATSNTTDEAEDNNIGSEDHTFTDLRQREVEPHILLRYRFRVYRQGSRSRKALEAAVFFTQSRVVHWYEEAKQMLEALPAAKSFQTSSLSTPSLQVNRGSPALKPFESYGHLASPRKHGEATTTGVPTNRPSRLGSSRPVGLPLLSLGTSLLPSTPELDRAECRTTTSSSGPLQLPAWAMEVLIRRESMRETLVRDLKERAFRVCAIPLPDMRVHCILPPAVPRYVTAHARGFPLSRTFAEEILSQQRALQFILLQREQENQRAIAARMRRERRRQERRESRQQERLAREEAWREARQRRQQSRRRQQQHRRDPTLISDEAGDSARETKWLMRSLNPVTFVSRVASVVKRVCIGCGDRTQNGLCNACRGGLPQDSDGVCKVCGGTAPLEPQRGAEAVHSAEPIMCMPLGEPSRQLHRHDRPTTDGGYDDASSPDGKRGAMQESSAAAGVAPLEDERKRFVPPEGEPVDVMIAVTPDNDSTPQWIQRAPLSQAGMTQAPRELQGRQISSAVAPGTSGRVSPTPVATEVTISPNGTDIFSGVPLTMKAGCGRVASPAEGTELQLRKPVSAGDKGGSGRRSVLPLSQTPSSASAKGGANSPLSQPHTSLGHGGGGGVSSGTSRILPSGSGASPRTSHWTAVHTATNANTYATPQSNSLATTASAGSPLAHANGCGNSSLSYTGNHVSHGYIQITSPVTGISTPSHLSARATATSPPGNEASSTTSGCGGGGTVSISSHTGSVVDRGPQGVLAPPPLVSDLTSLSTPSVDVAPASCVLSPADALMASRAITSNACLEATTGALHHYQDAEVVNLEDTNNCAGNMSACQHTLSHTHPRDAVSSHHHAQHQLAADDGGVPTAFPMLSPLPVPNNSMYGTFDAYYGHTVATPQAVLLRYQAHMALAAHRATDALSVQGSTSPRRRSVPIAAAPLVVEKATGWGEAPHGGCTSDHDSKTLAYGRSHTVSAPPTSASTGGNPQHLSGTRSAPRRSGSGLLPYTYSVDSVSSMYGTTQYPLYQYPEDSTGAAAVGYTGAPPTATSIPGLAALGNVSGASAPGSVGLTHGNAAGTHMHHLGGYSSGIFHGACCTGGTPAYTLAGGGGSSGRGAGNRFPASSVDGDVRPESSSAHSLSPRILDFPGDVNSSAAAPPLLPQVQHTHMNRLKQYNKLLSDLLGVAGGPMRSGISFYYTFGDATALLFNGSIRAPRDENIMELLDQHQWEKQQHLQQLSNIHATCSGGGGGGSATAATSGCSDVNAGGGDRTTCEVYSGSGSLFSCAMAASGAARVPASLAAIGASPPPPPPLPQQNPFFGSDSAVEGDVRRNDLRRQSSRATPPASSTSALALEDEGCSYLDYGDLAELQGVADDLETEQIEAQRARNRHFYSIFEHLHHAYQGTVLESIATDRAEALRANPVTTASSTSTLYTGLSGGVGTDYLFSSSTAPTAAERHTTASHGVGRTTLPFPGTSPLDVLGGRRDAVGLAGVLQWPRRLWGRVFDFVTWVGSLVGLVPTPRDGFTAAGAEGGGPCAYLPSSQLTSDGAKNGIDFAKLAEYFPGERILTFGDEWCLASRLDIHNGHFGLSPLQVWMATRYSRRFAGEVYLMDVIAAGSDPYYPAVRVLDEVVAHAVLYYHNHSLRDFVEDLEAELGLVYVPQTLWGRRALGLPDDEDEVQELDGLLYTATRRRQRAQEKNRHRRSHRNDTRGSLEKGRRVSPRSPPRSDKPHRGGGAPPPLSELASSTEATACYTEGSCHWPKGSCADRRRSLSSPSFTTPTGNTRAEIASGVSSAVAGSASAVPSVAAVSTERRPTPRRGRRPRYSHKDRLEEHEAAEYAWIQHQAKDQEEDEDVFYGVTAAAGLGGGDINIAPHVYDAVMEREVYDERMLLRELDYLKDFFIENRNVLLSAMLTTAGSNSLEAVFGVPATVFPFLLCARESVPFVASIFESLSYHYGALTYDSFSTYAYDVYCRDRPDVLRHTPRMFRMVNKSRRGCITYEELCRWMARKLSCGNNVHPNRHLVATSMSLRLPLALVAESRDEWDSYRCVLKSLSDGDDEEY